MSRFVLVLIALSGASGAYAAEGDLVVTGYLVDEGLHEEFPAVVTQADVNCDGYADAIVTSGCYGKDCYNAVHVWFGGPDGPSGAPSQTITTSWGIALASTVGLGDVNGDGCDELMLGESVHHGSPAGVDELTLNFMFPEADQYYYGYANAPIGDFDADGYEDIVIGSYDAAGASTSEGRVRIAFGSLHGPDSTLGTRVHGAGYADSYGYEVAGLGDVDGDGRDDVGAYAVAATCSWGRCGRVEVIYGRAGRRPMATAGTSIENEKGEVVFPMAGAGDLNGDGYADLVMSTAEFRSWSELYYDVQVYQGSAAGIDESTWTTFDLGFGGDQPSYGGAGDVDGDGYADLWIRVDDTLSVYRGGPSGVEATPSWSWPGLEAPVSADVDGDGRTELLAAYHPEGTSGQVLILSTLGTDADADGWADSVDCDDADDAVYPHSPDVCGDGVDSDCDGVDPACPSACDVAFSYPADGADLTAEGRFEWTGTCTSYWLELSPDPTFPAYDTEVVARLRVPSGAVSHELPAATWPSLARRFTDGGYARLVGAVPEGEATSETVSFVTSGSALSFPAPVVTCSVAPDEPADGSVIRGAPTFRWSGGCTAARLEFSEDADFPRWATFPVGAFRGTSASFTEARWSTVAAEFPSGGYWRVVGGAADGEHPSDPRSFTTRQRSVDWLLEGDLLVTEVMPNPRAVFDATGEWFEVYNNAGVAVDLDGLVVRDATHSFTVEGSLVVEAGDYVVFGATADERTNGGVSVDYTYGGLDTDSFRPGFPLSNAIGRVELMARGLLIDAVAWDDGATFPDPEGASMTFDGGEVEDGVRDATVNDDGARWCQATSTFGAGDLGTPGAPNDDCLATTLTIALGANFGDFVRVLERCNEAYDQYCSLYRVEVDAETWEVLDLVAVDGRRDRNLPTIDRTGEVVASEYSNGTPRNVVVHRLDVAVEANLGSGQFADFAHHDDLLVWSDYYEEVSLVRYAMEGGLPSPLAATSLGDGRDPQFFPDGSAVVFDTDRGTAERRVVMHDLTTGTQTDVTPADGCGNPAVSYDGSLVVCARDGTIMARTWDGSSWGAYDVLVAPEPPATYGARYKGCDELTFTAPEFCGDSDHLVVSAHCWTDVEVVPSDLSSLMVIELSTGITYDLHGALEAYLGVSGTSSRGIACPAR